jgi:lactate racemase
MRVAVEFQDERLDLDVPEGRLVGERHGPAGVAEGEVRALALRALEHPRQYPPLRQAVVPGDRVVVAFEPEVPAAREVLGAVVEVLRGAGVEGDAITLLATSGTADELAPLVPPGPSLAVHDPTDRDHLAYLASTAQGRRIYLNRLLTDADVTVPVGRLGYDPSLGYRGPWSVVFPALSDEETRRAFRSLATDERPDRDRPRPSLEESAEVSWLLGSQFHVGVVPGASGMVEVVAGLERAVRDEGSAAVDRAWAFRAETRAEVVVAGIGRPGAASRIEDLAEGLATATRLVRRGGKIVALSRAGGPIGPALRRLIGAGDDPRAGLAALRGHEADPDYPSALQMARALAWADVYLLSDLGRDDVEDLSMIALDRPEEGRRVVASAASCLVVSQAERTLADVADETD